MFYLVEGFQRGKGRKLAGEPVRVEAVMSQQVGPATESILLEADVVQITRISEETFSHFYLEKRRKRTGNE